MLSNIKSYACTSEIIKCDFVIPEFKCSVFYNFLKKQGFVPISSIINLPSNSNSTHRDFFDILQKCNSFLTFNIQRGRNPIGKGILKVYSSS